MRKCLLLMIVCLLLSACSSHTAHQAPAPPPIDLPIIFDNSAIDESVFITNSALESYRGPYKNAKGHKAFAQSESGAWNWRGNRTTRDNAINNALMWCRANNKLENEYPCKVIDVDGNWVND